MKSIQKLTLAVLVAASSTTFAAALIVEVDSGSADISGALNAGSATAVIQKVGAGIANVTGAVTGALELSAGQFNVSANGSMPSRVTFDGTSNNILEVNCASQAVPVLAMSVSGELLLANNASWAAAPSGGSTLTVEGTSGTIKNLAVNADMSGVATPVDVNTQANLQVGGTGHKATTGSHRIYGMLEILASPAVGCVPGQTTIYSGGTLKVDAAISVPQYNSTGDLFGTNDGPGGTSPFDTLTFNSGAKLMLGAGAVWARDITVGSAL